MANTQPTTGDDPNDAQDSEGRIGEKLRMLRKRRGHTLQAVADMTGISVGYLSELERDLASPSVKMLHDISRALGVSISWFFGDGQDHAAEIQYVVRTADREQIRFAEGITDFKLSSGAVKRIGLLYSVFEPGATSGEDPYTHDGEEAGTVIAGKLELWIEGRGVELSAGDSFSFASTLPHRYRNPGDAQAVVIWAMSPPSY